MFIKGGMGWNPGASFSMLEGIWAFVGMIAILASQAVWDKSEPDQIQK
jgi:hypothetical protein